ncbi:uncharacterized protein LOC119436254 [Dermacentor silvarum]|uniref:uncharacterized protein LOC119436254 n=1 Tax=Dermacentor silvarum TaxID=543639 RepID=UPI00189A1A51|nr:uncharacterized protein LOC119436254 [Dermacentor silvarum]
MRQPQDSMTGPARRRRHRRRILRQQPPTEEETLPDSDNEDRADQDGADGGISASDLPPWPAIVPPFFYFQPPPYANYPEVLFPFGEHGSLIDEQGNIFDPVYSTWLVDSEIHPRNEHLLHGDTDTFQQLGYAPSQQSSQSRRLGVAERVDEENGTGEPHTAADESTTTSVGAEGCGDAQLDPNIVEHGPWPELHACYGPVVTTYGTVSVMLRHGVRVDISVDRAVRVVNFDKECTAAVSGDGDRSCVCHPCGRVLQQGVAVDIATGSRLAKISSRGVIFTALNHGLVYLVDASGTKSTTERFKDLCYDVPLSLFHLSLHEDEEGFNECFRMVSQAKHWNNRRGDDVWIVGGVRIQQAPWGDVQVSRDLGSHVVWTSPTKGTMSVVTPLIKSVVTCDPTRFFFVRMNQKRLSANADGFAVRNGSQRAGFDSRGRLVLL